MRRRRNALAALSPIPLFIYVRNVLLFHARAPYYIIPERQPCGDEETDEGAQAFDFPLYDWGVAEAKMDDLERKHAYTIQRPPLAYADDLACLGAQQSGCDWYFSTADFDTAIVYGRMELKATAGDARVKIALTRGGE